MKCFTITGLNVRVGIESANLPIDNTLLSEDGIIKEAMVCPVTLKREGLNFLELFQDNLSSASAACKIVFSNPDKTVKKTSRVLIAYNPRELYPDRARNDRSQLLFRSAAVFVCMAEEGQMALSFVQGDPNQTFILQKGRPTCAARPRNVLAIPSKEEAEDYFIAYIN